MDVAHRFLCAGYIALPPYAPGSHAVGYQELDDLVRNPPKR
jgi:hypothetical protein